MGDGNKMIVELTTKEYDILENGKIVLDFYAQWCGQCKMVSPKVSEISDNKKDYLFYKVDADKQPELVEKYKITNLPTFVVLENGNIIGRGGITFLLEWGNKQ